LLCSEFSKAKLLLLLLLSRLIFVKFSFIVFYYVLCCVIIMYCVFLYFLFLYMFFFCIVCEVVEPVATNDCERGSQDKSSLHDDDDVGVDVSVNDWQWNETGTPRRLRQRQRRMRRRASSRHCLTLLRLACACVSLARLYSSLSAVCVCVRLPNINNIHTNNENDTKMWNAQIDLDLNRCLLVCSDGPSWSFPLLPPFPLSLSAFLFGCFVLLLVASKPLATLCK